MNENSRDACSDYCECDTDMSMWLLENYEKRWVWSQGCTTEFVVWQFEPDETDEGVE